MDFIVELIAELLLEGSIELTKNKKISKWIRYPILFLLILFFLLVIGMIFICGILLFKESKIAALLFIMLAILLLIAGLIKFKNIYFNKKN